MSKICSYSAFDISVIIIGFKQVNLHINSTFFNKSLLISNSLVYIVNILPLSLS